MKFKFIYATVIIVSIISSCGINIETRQIDMNESLKIVDSMDKYSFDKISLDKNNYLIINDTLLVSDNINIDSVKTIWTNYKLHLLDFAEKRNIDSNNLYKFKDLIIKSHNKTIIKEKNSYFFNEGGWIDSDFGKVYSKSNIKGKEKQFKFDRVQKITEIKEKPYWYDYYAD